MGAAVIKKESTTRQYTVERECELLTFLSETLPPKDRRNAKAMLKYRAVLVNGAVVTQYNHRLKRGHIVTVLPPSHGDDLTGVLYEDDELIVFNKPEGLLSVATERERDRTAYRLLTEHVQSRDPRGRIFIVHRLDRDTSGVLLAAKTEKMKLLLQDNWSELVKTRGYTALVEGVPEKSSDTIISWLRETSTHVVYDSKISGDGLEAVTEYRVLRAGTDYALLDIRLHTGRKNQIRVAMSGISHPVAGDKKYGAATNPLGRLALHAHLLELTHPETGKLMSFKAPVPRAFRRVNG
ncbi:MAG: RluA family pseudouridine synthase [Oscillospiraceae bacterium]|jgi:23S rRNA pseudouridine1911/1915/1917 synthase|nr:RluA family pseudouridine synthase [Oscillospiraceae bacterium]